MEHWFRYECAVNKKSVVFQRKLVLRINTFFPYNLRAFQMFEHTIYYMFNGFLGMFNTTGTTPTKLYIRQLPLGIFSIHSFIHSLNEWTKLFVFISMHGYIFREKDQMHILIAFNCYNLDPNCEGDFACSNLVLRFSKIFTLH